MYYDNLELVKQLIKIRHQIFNYTDDEKAAIAKMMDELIRLKVQELANPEESEYAQMQKHNKLFDN